MSERSSSPKKTSPKSPKGSPKKTSPKNSPKSFKHLPEEILVEVAKKIADSKKNAFDNLKNLDSFARTSETHYRIAYDRDTVKYFLSRVPKVSAREFYQAAREGKLDVIKNYIAYNFLKIKRNIAHRGALSEPLNMFFKKRIDTALIYASSNGRLEVVKFLLENGGDIHTNEENGANVYAQNDSPLQWASYNGHLEVVKLLLENGAKVNARNDSALSMASSRGHLEVVKLLLENGANVHAQNDNPLQWASTNGHLEVVRLLLKNGANVHAQDDSALRWASENGHTEVVNFLQNFRRN